jgi:hypothetical protein
LKGSCFITIRSPFVSCLISSGATSALCAGRDLITVTGCAATAAAAAAGAYLKRAIIN